MWVKIKDKSELIEGEKYKSIEGKVWTIGHISAHAVYLVGSERNVAQILVSAFWLVDAENDLAIEEMDDFIENYFRWVENELEGTGLEGTIFDDSSEEKGFID